MRIQTGVRKIQISKQGCKSTPKQKQLLQNDYLDKELAWEKVIQYEQAGVQLS